MVALCSAASFLLLELLFCVLLCEVTPNEGEIRKVLFWFFLFKSLFTVFEFYSEKKRLE